jgi:site-specific DNA-cytosine methylase
MAGKPTALGAYIFAGGFSVGVRKHFDILAHLEEWPFGCETSRQNLGVPVYEEPDTEGFYARAKQVTKGQGRTGLVYANPPCAPWSVASRGRSTDWRNDPRLSCVHRTFGLLPLLKPRVWIWESVRPAFSKGRELVDGLIEKADDLGYSATVLLVNSMYHGAAQNRPRFFLCLHDLPITFRESRAPTVTVGEVLKELRFKGKSRYPTFEPRKDLLPAVRRMNPGQSLRAAWEAMNRAKVAKHDPKMGKLKGRPSFLDARLAADGFSRAMTGGCKMYHPTEDRFLTGEECAALCGFPKSYMFAKNVYQEIARGVMPPVGEYLAGQVAHALKLETHHKRNHVRRNKDPRIVTVFQDRVEEAPLT